MEIIEVNLISQQICFHMSVFLEFYVVFSIYHIFLQVDTLQHISKFLHRLLELPLRVKVESEMAEVLGVALGLHHRDLLCCVPLRADNQNFKLHVTVNYQVA